MSRRNLGKIERGKPLYNQTLLEERAREFRCDPKEAHFSLAQDAHLMHSPSIKADLAMED